MAHRRGRLGIVGLGVFVSLFVAFATVLATGFPSRASTPRASGNTGLAVAGATQVGSIAAAVASIGSSPAAATAAPATPTPTTTPATPTPAPQTAAPPTAAPGTKTWLAWKPSGAGQVTRFNLGAPWVGGKTTDVSVYTPPGYDPNGTRLYPVVYEAPTGLTLWDSGTDVINQLNSLINSGAMPAAIVVFIDESSPPYSPSECTDSYDGQQWFDTFISNTVVNWVDVSYKTIQDPRARAIMGMSEGGFCAAELATRHPDVFGTSISFSGYYWAGAASSAAAKPFGSQAALDASSPALLVAQIPVATRSGMYFIVVANDGQDFYGPQATSFEKILSDNGYRYLAVNSPYGHGWDEAEAETPGAMAAWGAQLVVNGILA